MALPAVIFSIGARFGGGRIASAAAYSKVASKEIKEEVEKELDKRFDDFRDELESATPKATGRASKGWKKNKKYEAGRDNNDIISNDVPYIDPLEHGHSSQARNGMIDPAFKKAFK